jgi:hypothetical protein
MTKHDNESGSWSLFGASKGYMGSNEPGLIPRVIRDVPNSIVHYRE